jgi:DNA-binding MarR family transcriptional regulator
MDAPATAPADVEQAAAGLERLTALLRAQAWRGGGGLPPTQQAVLGLLDGADDGLRVGELARRIGVSAASLSDTVAALETRRLVSRGPDPDDRRATRVRLTRLGHAQARQLRRAAQSGAATALVAALPADDRAALLRSLQLMIREAQLRGMADGPRSCLGCRFFRPYASGQPQAPHLCAFVGTAFGDAELRIDCAEQEPESEQTATATAERFRDRIPPPPGG